MNMILLLTSRNMVKLSDYKALARCAFEGKGAVMVDFMSFINNFGLCMVFLIIFEDALKRIIEEGFDFQEDPFYV